MLEESSESVSDDVLVVNQELEIPLSELHFRFSRSSGPGGQHVNRSETRVEVLFDIAGSPSVTEAQRGRLLSRLSGHVDREGLLRVVSSATRSQSKNREDAVTRLRELMAAALRRRKRRVPTKPTAAARERRLTQKRVHSDRKRARRTAKAPDDQ